MAAPRKWNRNRTGKPKTGRENIHDELMSEWLGCEKPLNLGKNISQAGAFIDDILKKQFFAESLNEEEVKTVWKEVAGDFIGANTQPVSVKDGHLVLRVTQPAMRFHLEQLKPELLRKIKARFGKDKIRSVKFTLG
jgi:predicted nucleic acid-binding Zn ribbon protein